MPEFCNTKSARSLQWKLRSKQPRNLEKVRQASKDFDIPEQLVEIISGRGISNIDEYLSPTFRGSMPDPSTLQSMEAATQRIIQAIQSSERIAIFADYDVDGATSGAQMVRYFRALNHTNIEFYVPQRLSEGYGPNIPAITKLHANGATLLLLVDSGTTSFDPIDHARNIGMDVVVMDHHEPKIDSPLPQAILVNPKRVDDQSGLSYLCTAGLCFLFLASINRSLRKIGFFQSNNLQEPDLVGLSGLAALGTVCDVVPLVGFNRAIVTIGLNHMEKIPGIRALAQTIKAANKKEEFEWSAYTCGYRVGPPINAGGRISDTMQGIELLVEDNIDRAMEKAARLYSLNQERKEQQDRIVDDCREQIFTALAMQPEEDRVDQKIIVAYDPDWHPGIVGIVAGRVRDEFDTSAVVVGQFGKGSGRAIDGFNIGQSFIHAREIGLLQAGGGHAVAGGLTIDPERLQEFADFLNVEAEKVERPALEADLIVPIGSLKHDAIECFSMLEPFGKDNERPLIAFVGGILREVRLLPNKNGGPEHILCRLTGNKAEIKIILFSAVGTKLGEALRKAEGHYVDVLGRVRLETYAGVTRIEICRQGRDGLEDIMVGAPAMYFAES